MTQESNSDSVTLRRGLAKVRGRRWILWATLLIYLPGMMTGLSLQASGGTMGKLFAGWVALLCIAVGMATVVPCPACGKPFHTNGPTFLPVRRCVHCGLPLRADKVPQTVVETRDH